MGKALYFASFIAGGAVGAAVTWIFAKRKYEAIATEEIESVKKAFSKESHLVVVHNEDEAQKIADKAKNKPDIIDYGKKLAEEGYTNYNKALKDVKETAAHDYPDPYCIDPMEYGEDGYEKQSLIYYDEDGVVADESDNVIEDPDDIIGLENLDRFQGDSLYIRNERLNIDYEVLKDPGSFSEVLNHRNLTHGSEDDE